MKHPRYYDTTPEFRKRMGKVKLKNGDAERLLAKELWKKGSRYKKNYRGLPGSPDIAVLNIIEGQVCDGCSYDLQITYADKRKEGIKEDVTGGTFDPIIRRICT